MSLTVDNVNAQLVDLFAKVGQTIAEQITGNALPLIGKLSELGGAAAASKIFDDLNTQVVGALDTANTAIQNDPTTEVAKAIAEAINALGLSELSAKQTDAGGLEITFKADRTLDTGKAQINVGKAVGDFLDFTVDGGAKVSAALNTTVSFSALGELSLKDQTDELVVKIGADLSVKDAVAKLGLANVKFTDADPSKPEVEAQFSFDAFKSPFFGNQIFLNNTKQEASAALDLKFETDKVLGGALPNLSGEFNAGFSSIAAPPKIGVKNLELDLNSYVGILGKSLGETASLFNSGPLGTIVDLAIAPIPVLDDLGRTFGVSAGYDRVGKIGGGPNGVLTLGDLAVYGNSTLQQPLDQFYTAVGIIDELRKFSKTDGDAKIKVGDGALVGGSPIWTGDPNALGASLKEKLGSLGLSSTSKGLIENISIGGQTLGALTNPSSKSLTLGLLDNPTDIIKLLLNKPGDSPIDLIKYNVPPLQFEQQASVFFPILGPLGVQLAASLKARVDVDVGYDTKGLEKFEQGFYFTTAAVPAPFEATFANPRQKPFESVGSLGTTLTGGAGVELGVSSLFVNAGFGFDTFAYFDRVDNKFRPAGNFNCIFDVGGRAFVLVDATFKVDVGFFSIKIRVPIAEETIADFNIYKCPPPSVKPTPEAEGLATAIGSDLLLNVGDRADKRLIVDRDDDKPKQAINPDNKETPADESKFEAYVIANARDVVEKGADPKNDVTKQVNGLDVSAFGFTQRTDTPTVIKADFKDGNDRLIIQSDVKVDAVVSGGNGNDNLTGGAGNDLLNGDADDDVLVGAGGNDNLFGGSGSDKLIGGKGADLLNGGADFDTVDYSNANRDINDGVFVTITNNADVIGRGGDAEGDRLVDIEGITGTDFNDDLRAGFQVGQKLYFDGGKGNDTLIGGEGEDLLIGGAGADLLNGDDANTSENRSGYDSTSYVTSWGAVNIDLNKVRQFGGDAQGDQLFSIEAVEGSTKSDSLLGNGSDNFLSGNDGNDVIEGRGGKDSLNGGNGDDIVYAGGDGDTLDGGNGFDILSYERAGGPVTVDLGGSQTNFGRALSFGEYRFAGKEGDVTFTGPGADKIVMALPGQGGARGYSSFEKLIGSASDDTLTGDLAYNVIEGRDGNDRIDGDDGNDTLIGGFGADTLIGGNGQDWVSYRDAPSFVNVNLTTQGFFGTADGDTYAGIENIFGSIFSDVLVGDGSNNIINPNVYGRIPIIPGVFTSDFVSGGGGIDTLQVDYSGVNVDIGSGVVGGVGGFGEGDENSLTRTLLGGGSTIDTVQFNSIERLDIVGTSKADLIYGGFLNDKIVTNSGNDTVFAGTGADSVAAGDGNDTVFFGNNSLITVPFILDGGSDFDTLSISLGGETQNINLVGGSFVEKFQFSLPNGAAATNFEVLKNVATGSGDDFVAQAGVFDNIIFTGDGDDTIAPGLGNDFVIAGSERPGQSVKVGGSAEFPNFGPLNTQGDLLKLDYSMLGSEYSVKSSSTSVDKNLGSDPKFDYLGSYSLFENIGKYSYALISSGLSSSILETSGTVSYRDIERVDVSGSQGNDSLIGVNKNVGDFFQNKFTASIGPQNDILRGLGGNDTLRGLTGNDLLDGGDGNDVLYGTELRPTVDQFFGGRTKDYIDARQVDTLIGGAGADTFVLGESTTTIAGVSSPNGVFYNNGGFGDYALIQDFTPNQGDRLQLFGRPSDYTSTSVNEQGQLSTQISYKGDMIAILTGFLGQGFEPFNFNANYIDYVRNFNIGSPDVNLPTLPPPGVIVRSLTLAEPVAGNLPLTSGLDLVSLNPQPLPPGPNDLGNLPLTTGLEQVTLNPQPLPLGPSPLIATNGLNVLSLETPETLPVAETKVAETTAADPVAVPQALVAATATDDWVTQNGNASELKAILDGGTGGAGSTLTLSGSAEAFGTFSEANPFGLGKGIILSTGKVEDLPGVNTVENGGTNVTSVPVTFEKIGRVNGADLDGSDIFKADLSNLGINIKSITISDSNSKFGGGSGDRSGFDIGAIALSAKDIGFVSNGNNLDTTVGLPKLDALDFSLASIEFEGGELRRSTISTDLSGTFGGLILNAPALGVFGDSFGGGSVTLGDGGTIAFDLKSPVSAKGPLYLYIAEQGASGETVSAVLNVSADSVEPSGDLSTDLGATGLDGDETSLTYTFTPKAGDTGFSLDVVLFTEELPEFDGIALSDLFSIQLNGKEVGALSNGASLSLKSLLFSASNDLVLNPAGTGPLADKIKADAYTKTLTISGPIEPGAVNTLTIEVKDGRDAFLDSGLLIKDGSFKTFVLPEPEPINASPSITPPTGNVLVAENSTDVLTVAASDPDVGQSLTFSISGGDDATVFDIDPTSGKLTFKTAPDFEAPADANGDNIYDVAVTVSDDGVVPLTATQSVSVAVVNTIDTAPSITAPTGPLAIAENKKDVVTIAAVAGEAGQTLTFAIDGGADADLFAIDPTTGKLSFKAAPDFEAPKDNGKDNVYDVAVKVSDSATPSLFDTRSIAVAVTNTIDTAPSITAPSGPVAIAENKTDVVTIAAVAGEAGQTLTFAIDGGADRDLFAIDPTTGKLSFKAAPDFEAPKDTGKDNVYDVAVKVSDSATPSLFDTRSIAVAVTNVSELDLRVKGTDGADILTGTAENDTIDAGAGNDRVFGLAGADSLVGGDGDDFVDAGAGNDTVLGGEGSDTVRGAAGADSISGGNGIDWIYAGDGNDTAFGGAGNDFIWGDAGNDDLFGEAGHDLVQGGAGNDTLSGGGGRDSFQYWNSNADKVLNLKAIWGSDTISDFTLGTGPDADRLDLANFWARFDDSARLDFLKAANEVLKGKGDLGSSFVFKTNLGGDGDGEWTEGFTNAGTISEQVLQLSTLSGVKYTVALNYTLDDESLKISIWETEKRNTAATIELDNIKPGSSFKSYNLTEDDQKVWQGMSTADVVTFFAGETDGNNDTIDTGKSAKGVQAYGFGGDDAIMGTVKADLIYGGDGKDTIDGGAGRDRLEGGNHNDLIKGGAGNDDLLGNDGADRLEGGEGGDFLYGGKNSLKSDADVLYGNLGADTFIIGATVTADGLIKFDGNVVIKDFDLAQGDKVTLATEIVGWDLSKSTFNQKAWFESVKENGEYSAADRAIKITDSAGLTLTLENVDIPQGFSATSSVDAALLNMFGLA